MSCLRARLRAGRPAVRAGAEAVVLHRLRQALRALAHGVERLALVLDRAVGVALAEFALRLVHGLAGVAELIHLVALVVLLAGLLLPGRQPVLAQLVEQLLELVAQRLLVLAQVAELLPCSCRCRWRGARRRSWPFLKVWSRNCCCLRIMSLSSSSADIHVVAAVVAGVGLRHLQVFQHRLQLLEQALRGLLVAGAGELLQPVEHRLQVLRASVLLLRSSGRASCSGFLLHLLGQRLHELVERGAQVVHQLLELFAAGAALERLAQRLLRGAQVALGLRHVAVFDLRRHLPQPRHHRAQLIVALGAVEVANRSSAGRDRRRPRA